MKNIINQLINELQKPKYQSPDHSEHFDTFLQHAQRFLIDSAVTGKRVKVTANCIYQGHVLTVKHVYMLPSDVSGASYRLDLTGTEFQKERGYNDTVMWDNNFEWVDPAPELPELKSKQP